MKERFSPEANIHYRISSADELTSDLSVLSSFIMHHQKHQRPRLDTLLKYYEGRNTKVLRERRRRESHLADHRATHNFAEYVSGFIQGYLVGVPIKTSYPDEEIEETIREINRDNNADEHNSDIVLDQSIFGRAYELLYRSKNDKTRFTISDVRETFVIYDDTVEMDPVAGVRYVYNRFTDKTTVFLYTDSEIITYDLDYDYKLHKKDEAIHAFGDVPIIEYRNNRFRRGDFEKVLNLIDLYDEAQSDTANYMTDFNDAMLKIVGNLKIDEDQAKKMKEHNLLFLQTEPNPDGAETKADADYIYKKYDVEGTEKYKDRIKNDIHMFTHTPNMDDESFAGTQSGEALKYKLFGLEQKRATKERMFKKSLRKRYELINNMMNVASEGDFDVDEIEIKFTPNLPKNVMEEIEAFTKLGGELSDKTKLSILSFVENPDEELEKIEEESSTSRQLEQMFPFDLDEETTSENE